MPLPKSWRVTLVLDAHKRQAIFAAFGADLLGVDPNSAASKGLDDPLAAFTLILKTDPRNVIDRMTLEEHVERTLRDVDGVVAIGSIEPL